MINPMLLALEAAALAAAAVVLATAIVGVASRVSRMRRRTGYQPARSGAVFTDGFANDYAAKRDAFEHELGEQRQAQGAANAGPRLCEYCGAALSKRENEYTSAFNIRKHCDKVCASRGRVGTLEEREEILRQVIEFAGRKRPPSLREIGRRIGRSYETVRNVLAESGNFEEYATRRRVLRSAESEDDMATLAARRAKLQRAELAIDGKPRAVNKDLGERIRQGKLQAAERRRASSC